MTRNDRLRITIALACWNTMALSALPQEGPPAIRDLYSTESFNVVVTVSDRTASNTFYGDVLGLKKAGVWDTMPENGTMDIYLAGNTRLKLVSFPRKLPKQAGGLENARGLRLLTFTLDDEEGVTRRLMAHGCEISGFGKLAGTEFSQCFVRDPDDNQVELVLVPKGTDARRGRFAVGLAVADVEASRRFYGRVLGLEEQPPQKRADGRPIYSFQFGNEVVKFWPADRELPAWTGYHGDAVGIRYIQFPVRDMAKAHAYFMTAGTNVIRAPYAFAPPRTWLMFVGDPDGVWIEFPGRPAAKDK
jgi:catechol 2,3-dioxygenase-like lactoylglutathione lyase family enzyme